MILQNLKLVFVIVTLFVRKLQAQYPSVACPDIFRYDQSGGEVVGIVTINEVDYGDTVVDIKLSQDGVIESKNVGEISLNFDINKSFDYIISGTAFSYKVKFALPNVIPTVRGIRLNGVEICPGPEASASETTIDLQHTITVPGSPIKKLRTTIKPTTRKSYTTTTRKPQTTTTPKPYTTTAITPGEKNDLPSYLKYKLDGKATNNNYNNNAFGTTTTNPPRTTAFPTTTTTPRTKQPPPNFLAKPVNFIQRQKEWTYINSVCGYENEMLATKLVVKGEDVERSRFPWIVALFVKTRRQLSFQCGGSLITTRTVISAAHCFHTVHNLIREEDILVSVGRHEINEWTLSDITFNINVEKILRHPDYRQELDNNDADLAILQLEKSVAFSIYIRPVCMWEGVLDVLEIEGISGIVVGWGRNEDGDELTTTPKLATARVASETSCVKSNPKFIPLTSNRTLCAGNLDGSGPCSGDSGSGLMIKYKNKWSLRGVVSLALDSDTEIHQCNLQEYVVYTDIAQFLGWIYGNCVF